MVRKYKRKSVRGEKYTQEQLHKVVLMCKQGELSAKLAAKTYNIPLSTLRNIHGRRGVKSKSMGRGTAIPTEVEGKIANGIKQMAKWGWGLTRKEIAWELVGMYVNKNNIKTPFKDGVPGEEWFLAFKARHHI